VTLATQSGGFGVGGNSPSDFVEPRPEIPPCRKRIRFAGQHEECRLKRVLGIMRVPKRDVTGVVHKRAMTLHEHGKSGLAIGIAAGTSHAQQLIVAELAKLGVADRSAHVIKDRSGRVVRHGIPGDLGLPTG
jgi:hypothetical protein